MPRYLVQFDFGPFPFQSGRFLARFQAVAPSSEYNAVYGTVAPSSASNTVYGTVAPSS